MYKAIMFIFIITLQGCAYGIIKGGATIVDKLNPPETFVPDEPFVEKVNIIACIKMLEECRDV